MRGRWRTVAGVAAVLAATFVFSASRPADACSCALGDPPPTEWDRHDRAELVIVGRAVEEQPVPYSEHPGSVDGISYLFDVEFVHKGAVDDPVRLWTSNSSASCGYGLVIGELYKLYPHRREDGSLAIGLCGGNRVATEADLAPLPPRPTEPPPPETTVPEDTTTTTAESTTSTSVAEDTTSSSTTTTTESDAVALVVDEGGDDGGGDAWAVAGAGAAASAAAIGLILVSRSRRAIAD